MLCPNCKSEIIEQQDHKIFCAVCGWLELLPEGGWIPSNQPETAKQENEVNMTEDKKSQPEKPAGDVKQSAEIKDQPAEEVKKPQVEVKEQPVEKSEEFGVNISFDDD